jgi:deoxyribodipyrimidine photo-lyase
MERRDADTICSSESLAHCDGMSVAVVWFKVSELRLHDNPALVAAHTQNDLVEHCFIYDPRCVHTSGYDSTRMGLKRARFLCESVRDLHERLQRHNKRLWVLYGEPEILVPAIASTFGAQSVYTGSEVAQEEVALSDAVERALQSQHIRFSTHWGGTLYEPDVRCSGRVYLSPN